MRSHAPVTGGGAGDLYRFRDTTRVNLSVIVYDLSEESAAQPTDALRVANEGEAFVVVLDLLVQRGTYASFQLMSARTDSLLVGSRVVPAHIVLASAGRGGLINYELQYLYLIEGKLVKVRATVPQGMLERANIDVFAASLVRAMVP